MMLATDALAIRPASPVHEARMMYALHTSYSCILARGGTPRWLYVSPDLALLGREFGRGFSIPVRVAPGYPPLTAVFSQETL